MRRILCGIETEYGLTVEGRGAEDQIEDAQMVVRSYPDDHLAVWDYRSESPRSDLRGFQIKSLAYDERDAVYDAGRAKGPDAEVRSDRILANGARFYNDHGHPEYASPECWSPWELAMQDKAGELAVWRAAKAYEQESGRRIGLYKNNTDFHGASYGTHESYLAPRELGFERLYAALTPILVSRIVVGGAGKVGSESGPSCDFQMSQRADFFMERANAETLARRPIFNTRDEPHAERRKWIRVHVIATDANMMAGCTARKAALMQWAIRLEIEGRCPQWELHDPVAAIKTVSRTLDSEPRIELAGRSWTTPRQILESLMESAEANLELPDEELQIMRETRGLLEIQYSDPDRFARSVDWAAKRTLIAQFRDSEDLAWSDPHLQALDLAYCSLDPEESLFNALVDAEMVDAQPTTSELQSRLENVHEPTRARARGMAVRRWKEQLATASWGSLVLRDGEDLIEAQLPPDWEYGDDFLGVESHEDFLRWISEKSQQ